MATPTAVLRRIAAALRRMPGGTMLLHLLGALRRRTTAAPSPTLPASPASFEKWLRRRSLRPMRGDLRLTESAGESVPGTKVVVVLHVYFQELMGQLFDSLATIPVEHDVIVTNASATSLTLPTALSPLTGRVSVYDVENHGRDILPLVRVVNAGLLDDYSLVLKLHTKKSEWRDTHDTATGSGAQWRDSFLSTLVGSTEQVERILSAFAGDRELGIVTSPDSLLDAEWWGDNQATSRQLLRRIQLRLQQDRLVFPAGSMYWIRSFVLQGLRSLELTPADFESEAGQVNATTAHAVERLIGYLAGEAEYSQRTTDDLPPVATGAAEVFAAASTPVPRARVFPFYLPQFHTFPENDEWWGTGFTEWTNVTAARPVFAGQKQPLLPSELGFYDLRTPGVLDRQYTLASDHGIEGFMFYYYWFAGRRLMDLPVESVASGERESPFCLMWANENWTRTWDGGDSDILIGQDYDAVPAEDFIDDVLHLLTNPRYVTIDGKPVIAVYRPMQMSNFPSVVKVWRERAEQAGLHGLMVLAVDVSHSMQGLGDDPTTFGLDGSLGFPPHNHRWAARKRDDLRVDRRFHGNLLSYPAMANSAIKGLAKDPHRDNYYPCVLVNFDNTARRQWRGDVWYGANPYTFRRWLKAAVDFVQERPADERTVFINAWNEWAESAVLEPSAAFGRSYLQAVRSVLLS